MAQKPEGKACHIHKLSRLGPPAVKDSSQISVGQTAYMFKMHGCLSSKRRIIRIQYLSMIRSASRKLSLNISAATKQADS